MPSSLRTADRALAHGALCDRRGLGVEQLEELSLGEVVLDRDSDAACNEEALAGLDGLVDEAPLCRGEIEHLRPCLEVGGALLVEQEEVRVDHHVSRVGVEQHVRGVLGDSGADEAELSALAPEPGEVVDDGRVPEEGLDLVDVEPRDDIPGRRDHDTVPHHLQGGEHAEHLHVLSQLVHVDVGDPVLEADVALAVEEAEGAMDVALVAKRDVPGLGLGLLREDGMEVLQGREPVFEGAAVVGQADAPRDDGPVVLRQALRSLGHERGREGQDRVCLVGELGRVAAVRYGSRVERVERRVGSRRKADVRSPQGADEVAVLSGRVEDDHLVAGMREDGIRDLPLDGEGLAAAGLSANEAHRARKESPVADDEVSRLLGLAIVTAAGLVQLLAGERHLHGDLAGRQVPEDVDVVVAQGKHRVERLALPQQDDSVQGLAGGGRGDKRPRGGERDDQAGLHSLQARAPRHNRQAEREGLQDAARPDEIRLRRAQEAEERRRHRRAAHRAHAGVDARVRRPRSRRARARRRRYSPAGRGGVQDGAGIAPRIVARGEPAIAQRRPPESPLPDSLRASFRARSRSA